MTTRLQGQAESYSISSNTIAKTQEREAASVGGPDHTEHLLRSF